ncbi:MAG: M20/M25/M40 family metallo-hydrolase [Janthinobacterium lividum]
MSDQQRLAALAADAGLHRAFGWLHLNELQLRRWQLEFLPIAAPPFGEGDRARWFCDRFVEFGLMKAHIDAEGNAIALLPGHTGSLETGAIVLSAHLDTVFPAEINCTPREDGDIIRGPGACDNGAGLAALLGLAAALQRSGLQPPCPVIFVANVGEEGEGDLRGMRHLFASPPFDAEIAAVIALEGAGNALVVDRALGSRRLRATVTGPGGHSWADADRPNPILALSSALLAITRVHLPKQPRTTLNVGRLQGGTSVNSIPASATADLDLRSTSEMALDRLELTVLTRLSAEIEAETAGENSGTVPLSLHIERTGHRAVGALAADSFLMHSLRAVDRHLGIATELRIGSTDANLPLSLGVPALAIGAGGIGGGLHTAGEWYDPTGRELALRRVLLLLLDCCTHVAQAQQRTESPIAL